MKYKILLLVLSLVLLTSCGTQSISDIKSQDYVGKEVTIQGDVINTIKLGELSGFTIQDETDSIFVASNALPAEGKNKFVKGILMKNILGYYIQTGE